MSGPTGAPIRRACEWDLAPRPSDFLGEPPARTPDCARCDDFRFIMPGGRGTEVPCPECGEEEADRG